MPVEWQALLLANLAVAAGAAIQGTVGYGMNLIALPLLLALDPALVPGPLLVAHLLLVLSLTTLDRKEIDRKTLVLATAAAIPGTAAGALILAYLSHGAFVIFTAAVLILTTALAGRRTPIAWSGRNVCVAGFVSGFCGTTTSINGPPLAAVLVGSRLLPQVRATLACFLLISTLLSLGGLFIVGKFHMNSVVLALGMAPGVLAGVLTARYGLRRVAARISARGLFFGASGLATAIFLGREVLRQI